MLTTLAQILTNIASRFVPGVPAGNTTAELVSTLEEIANSYKHLLIAGATASTGPVAMNSLEGIMYGFGGTPLDGNLTFDFTNAKVGAWAMVYHVEGDPFTIPAEVSNAQQLEDTYAGGAIWRFDLVRVSPSPLIIGTPVHAIGAAVLDADDFVPSSSVLIEDVAGQVKLHQQRTLVPVTGSLSISNIDAYHNSILYCKGNGGPSTITLPQMTGSQGSGTYTRPFFRITIVAAETNPVNNNLSVNFSPNDVVTPANLNGKAVTSLPGIFSNITMGTGEIITLVCWSGTWYLEDSNLALVDLNTFAALLPAPKVSYPVLTLVDTPAMQINVNSHRNFKWLIGGNRTITGFTGEPAGLYYGEVEVEVGATGATVAIDIEDAQIAKDQQFPTGLAVGSRVLITWRRNADLRYDFTITELEDIVPPSAPANPTGTATLTGSGFVSGNLTGTYTYAQAGGILEDTGAGGTLYQFKSYASQGAADADTANTSGTALTSQLPTNGNDQVFTLTIDEDTEHVLFWVKVRGIGGIESAWIKSNRIGPVAQAPTVPSLTLLGKIAAEADGAVPPTNTQFTDNITLASSGSNDKLIVVLQGEGSAGVIPAGTTCTIGGQSATLLGSIHVGGGNNAFIAAWELSKANFPANGTVAVVANTSFACSAGFIRVYLVSGTNQSAIGTGARLFQSLGSNVTFAFNDMSLTGQCRVLAIVNHGTANRLVSSTSGFDELENGNWPSPIGGTGSDGVFEKVIPTSGASTLSSAFQHDATAGATVGMQLVFYPA